MAVFHKVKHAVSAHQCQVRGARAGAAFGTAADVNAEALEKLKVYGIKTIQSDLSDSKKLDELANVLYEHPELKIEISAHTESLGALAQNLEISKYRAQMAIQYLLKEGIPSEQISGNGFGEAFLLNHCKDGVNCSMEEHLFNQRLEIRVLAGVEN